MREARAPPRDLRELATQLGRLEAAPRVVNASPPDYRAGRLDTFWIGRQNPPEHFQVEAELRYVGKHAYWYVQRGVSVSERALRESAEMFDTRIYPEVRRLVGSEAFPGIDNDPRVTIFNGDVPGVAGYASSADGYPRSVHPYSNEREIVYVNLKAGELGTRGYFATLAHEFTHVVHENVNRMESTWVKEGLAQLVSSLVVADTSLASGGFASNPDIQLTSWSDGEPGSTPLGAHYEAASWFLQYLFDLFGEEALYALLAHDLRGPDTVEAFLRERGLQETFESVFADWAVANALGRSRGGWQRSYRSGQPEAPRPRRLRAGADVQESVAQFATDYFEVVREASIQFDGSATTPVLGTQPASGAAMWYGGRADAATASMTRPLALSSVDSATLTYRLWYDIEQDYDYAYVSVSEDSGRRWTLLESARMSRTNPTGNNLGAGYTGRSGDGPEPRWVEESIDLTPYAGREIWIRFSYVTDDAFVRDGIVLDDILVDAIGVTDGAEPGAPEWGFQGWARIGGAVPQSWLVQVIEMAGDGVRVTRVPIDRSGRGAWRASAQSADRTVIAISGTSPGTTQRASYRLSVNGP